MIKHLYFTEYKMGWWTALVIFYKYMYIVLSASQVVLMVKNPPAIRDTRRPTRPRFDPWAGKIPWRARQPIPVFLHGEFHEQRNLAGSIP